MAQFAIDLSAAIVPYRHLLESLIREEISREDFETQYLDIYADDPTMHSDEIFDVVDGFFADVDAYVSNPRIRDASAGDLGAEELRVRAKLPLQRAGG